MLQITTFASHALKADWICKLFYDVTSISTYVEIFSGLGSF